MKGMPEWIESGALERVKLRRLRSSNSTDDNDGQLSLKQGYDTAVHLGEYKQSQQLIFLNPR